MLGYLKDGDIVRVDLLKRSVDVLLSPEEIERRRTEMGPYVKRDPRPSQTPWQEIFRREVGELSDGMVLKEAVKFQRIAQTYKPRNNH
jgi:dihydroxy-acid dehydratase